jgi:hypothetical protein
LQLWHRLLRICKLSEIHDRRPFVQLFHLLGMWGGLVTELCQAQHSGLPCSS